MGSPPWTVAALSDASFAARGVGQVSQSAVETVRDRVQLALEHEWDRAVAPEGPCLLLDGGTLTWDQIDRGLVSALRRVLAELDPKSEAMVRASWGAGAPPSSQAEVAQRHGVSRQRVSQVALRCRTLFRHSLPLDAQVLGARLAAFEGPVDGVLSEFAGCFSRSWAARELLAAAVGLPTMPRPAPAPVRPRQTAVHGAVDPRRQEVEHALDAWWSRHLPPAPLDVLGAYLVDALGGDITFALTRAREVEMLAEVAGGFAPRRLSKRAAAAHVLLGIPEGLHMAALCARLDAAALSRASGRRAWDKAVHDNRLLWLDSGPEDRPVWRHVDFFPWSEERCRDELARLRAALGPTGSTRLAEYVRDLPGRPLYPLRHVVRWLGGDAGVYLVARTRPHTAAVSLDPAMSPALADSHVLRVLDVSADALTARELSEALERRFATDGIRQALRRLCAQQRVVRDVGHRYRLASQ